jgi:hypothetical protein
MFNYNNLWNTIRDNIDRNSVQEQEETQDQYHIYSIPDKQIIENNSNLLDNIIQHPFINNITYNRFQMLKECYIIFYRINVFNKYHYVEYYINNNFSKISLTTETTAFNIFENIIIETEKTIRGIKRFKGIYEHNDNQYMFIQIRENITTNMWVNLWDIVVYNHYFGERFHTEVIDFFVDNNSISNLKLNNQIILKPSVLYCRVNDMYLPYIDKHKSIQHCQDDSLIKLTRYRKDDNVRVICFITFDKKLIKPDNDDSLRINEFVIDKINKCWIFKNEDKLSIHAKIN